MPAWPPPALAGEALVLPPVGFLIKIKKLKWSPKLVNYHLLDYLCLTAPPLGLGAPDLAPASPLPAEVALGDIVILFNYLFKLTQKFLLKSKISCLKS